MKSIILLGISLILAWQVGFAAFSTSRHVEIYFTTHNLSHETLPFGVKQISNPSNEPCVAYNSAYNIRSGLGVTLSTLGNNSLNYIFHWGQDIKAPCDTCWSGYNVPIGCTGDKAANPTLKLQVWGYQQEIIGNITLVYYGGGNNLQFGCYSDQVSPNNNTILTCGQINNNVGHDRSAVTIKIWYLK